MKYLFNSIYLIILFFSLITKAEPVQTMTFEEGMTLVVYVDHDNDESKQVESNEDKESE